MDFGNYRPPYATKTLMVQDYYKNFWKLNIIHPEYFDHITDEYNIKIEASLKNSPECLIDFTLDSWPSKIVYEERGTARKIIPIKTYDWSELSHIVWRQLLDFYYNVMSSVFTVKIIEENRL